MIVTKSLPSFGLNDVTMIAQTPLRPTEGQNHTMTNKPAPDVSTPIPPTPDAGTPVVTDDLSALAAPEVFSPAGLEVPEQVKQWVEDGFTYWQAHPKEWRTVPLSSEVAAEAILAQARHYTKALREVPLTVQVREIQKDPAKPGAVKLVYRVRTRVQSGRKSTTAGE